MGVKTGTTDAAGPCLVAAYQDGAALFPSVVFNSPDRYGETMSLLNYAAKNYAPAVAGYKKDAPWDTGLRMGEVYSMQRATSAF